VTPFLPARKNVALKGIDEAGASSPASCFGKGAVSQPSPNGSFAYPNPRGNLSKFDFLLIKLNHLLVAVLLLSTASEASLFDTARSRRTPFFFWYG
jgi:hypothetical protein